MDRTQVSHKHWVRSSLLREKLTGQLCGYRVLCHHACTQTHALGWHRSYVNAHHTQDSLVQQAGHSCSPSDVLMPSGLAREFARLLGSVTTSETSCPACGVSTTDSGGLISTYVTCTCNVTVGTWQAAQQCSLTLILTPHVSEAYDANATEGKGRLSPAAGDLLQDSR